MMRASPLARAWRARSSFDRLSNLRMPTHSPVRPFRPSVDFFRLCLFFPISLPLNARCFTRPRTAEESPPSERYEDERKRVSHPNRKRLFARLHPRLLQSFSSVVLFPPCELSLVPLSPSPRLKSRTTPIPGFARIKVTRTVFMGIRARNRFAIYSARKEKRVRKIRVGFKT